MNHTLEGPWDDRLDAYHDGELSPGETSLVHEHLAGCAACRDRLDQIAQVSRSIRSLPVEPMPGALKTSILARARPAPRARSAMPWRFTSLAAAAAAVIVAVTVWRNGSPPPAPGRQIDEFQREQSAGEGPSDAAKVGAGPAGAAPPDSALGDVRLDSPLKELAKAESKDKPQASRRKREAAGSRPQREEARPAPMEAEKDDDARRAFALSEPATVPGDVAAPTAPRAMAAPAAPPPSGGVFARYTTTLVFENDRPARLTPITAQQAGQDGEAPGDVSLRARKESAPEARSLAGQSAAAAAGPSPITFLVQADADGRILSAGPIGARTQNTTVVESARALLVGSRLVPFEPGRAMTVVVEVNLPAF